MDEIKEIIPHFGIEDLKLGTYLKDIVAELGTDYEEERETVENGIQTVILTYLDLGVDLIFSSEDDYRLATITFYLPAYQLFGKELIGLPEAEFLGAVKSKLIDIELDFQDPEIESKDYSSPAKGLSFWVQNGLLDSISVLPDFNEEGTVAIYPA